MDSLRPGASSFLAYTSSLDGSRRIGRASKPSRRTQGVLEQGLDAQFRRPVTQIAVVERPDDEQEILDVGPVLGPVGQQLEQQRSSAETTGTARPSRVEGTRLSNAERTKAVFARKRSTRHTLLDSTQPRLTLRMPASENPASSKACRSRLSSSP